jgi:hypothetical protein
VSVFEDEKVALLPFNMAQYLLGITSVFAFATATTA